jgi:hypothetical protein
MSSRIPVAISFNEVANFLGVVGVIGSLIFVGLELRQTQRIALAGQVQERAKMQTDRLIGYVSGNAEAFRLFQMQDVSFTELSEDEKQLAIIQHQWKGVMLENNYFQFNNGLYGDEYWEQTRGRLERWYNTCDLRPTLTENSFIKSFLEYMQSLPDECAQ